MSDRVSTKQHLQIKDCFGVSEADIVKQTVWPLTDE